MNAARAHLPSSAAEPDRVRLRATFEASSLRRAAAVAAELKRIVGEQAQIHPVAPLRASFPTVTDSGTWTVELTMPAMQLSSAAIHLWERKLLALEYRWPGSRFLGWTTSAMPAISERRPAAVPQRSSANGWPARSQRDLVAASLLRRPRAEGPGMVLSRTPVP
jgi:hypothetical protein